MGLHENNGLYEMETIIKFKGKIKLHAVKSEQLILNLSNMELCNETHKITGEVVKGDKSLEGIVFLDRKLFMNDAEMFFIKVGCGELTVSSSSFKKIFH